MTPTDASVEAVARELEARARKADTVAELGFSMANDAHLCLPFRQALVFGADERLLTVSGLAEISENTPYLDWLRRTWPWLRARLGDNGGWLAPDAATLQSAPAGIADGWQEWWPAGALLIPLRRRSGEALGWLCFLLDTPPASAQLAVLQRVAPTWAYCWEMLGGPAQRPLAGRWAALGRRRWLLPALVLLVLMIPVRQTALAPAEVIALDATAITAALDGVVRQLHVRPNQPVKAGTLLFSLDDTTLRNRLEVARKSVAVADAELAAATQMSFENVRSREELTQLQGRAQEKRAELAAVQAELARVEVRAPHDGVAVFADAEEWQGRPVRTGERIMSLADPSRPGVLIHLPVADAITLEPGAPLRLFLTVRPLDPLPASITETSYQALPSPDGIASYRLRGHFDDDHAEARIGLRGTAKLYGERVSLAYYLLRRPLATLREWTGL